MNDRRSAFTEQQRTLLENFGVDNGSHAYVDQHALRYRETLALMEGMSVDRVLELGGTSPFAFSLLLKQAFPEAEIVLAQNSAAEFPGELKSQAQPNELRLHARSQQALGEARFPVYHFNAETDRWPLPDESVDLVVCMEILEHLCVDPLFLFTEAHRVLRGSGLLLVTTPNLASLESVNALLDGDTPYRYPSYSRYGVYGRHNREYVPKEVEELGLAAGFRTEEIYTRDVYPVNRVLRVSADEVAKLAQSPVERGQNIFYLGQKAVGLTGDAPAVLYDFDPLLHQADLCTEPWDISDAVSRSVRFTVHVRNCGRYTWHSHGDDITCIGVQLLDPPLRLRQRDFTRILFAEPVEPERSITVDCDIELPENFRDGWLKIDIVHERVCWFGEQNGSRPQPCVIRVRRR